MSGVSNPFVKALWVPGLPHLTFQSEGWGELKKAYQSVADEIKALKPDVLVVYSAQWISVLGHSFQADANPKGVHVDDNWYFLPGARDFKFSLNVDVDLAKAAEVNAKAKGLATKLVDYEGFPIDTGTLTAMSYLNPENQIPVVIVSSNIYCGREDSEKLGQALSEAVSKSGKKAVLVTISSLSNRFITEEIDPKNDHLAKPEDDQWNQKILELLKQGKNKEAANLAPEYVAAANPEMQFKGFYWMMGALGYPDTPADVKAYGPVWGTGNAIFEYQF